MALIYIVEDDPGIREIETIALKNSNYIVEAFERAAPFFSRVGEILPDLVLLDIMLPDENGYEIVRKLRANPLTEKIPVIMVTAKTSELDLVRGLDGGADDYVRKPFSLMELLSRVRALIRRTAEDDPKPLSLGSICLDPERHTVTAAGQPVELTYKEFELLAYFMENNGIALPREKILNSVWNYDYFGDARTIDTHVKKLRAKMGDRGSYIKTIWGMGYKFDTTEEEA